MIVAGEVGRPGQLALSGPLSVFEAIRKTGGLTKGADGRHVLVVRGISRSMVDFVEFTPDPNPRTRLSNSPVKPMVTVRKGPIPSGRSFALARGDRILVPRWIDRIGITGAVHKPGEYNLDEGLTVMKALALAGSFRSLARPERISILRHQRPASGPGRGCPGTRAIRVDAVRIFKSLAPDLALTPGDVIDVPTENALACETKGPRPQPGADRQ